MIRKRLLSLSFLLLFTFSIFAVLNLNTIGVSAVEYPALYVDSPSITDVGMTPGSTFTVSIKTDYAVSINPDYPGDDIHSYQLILSYNPFVLHGVSVTNGDLITGSPYAVFIPGTFDNTAGELSTTSAFFADLEPTTVVSGPGTLAYVTFEVVGYGDSPITIAGSAIVSTILFGFTEGGWGHKYEIINAYTQPDHVQHGYFCNTDPPPTHDIAVIGVTPNDTEVLQSELVDVTVDVENQGTVIERFDVSLYYDMYNLIERVTNVILGGGDNVSLTFTWDTTEVSATTHTLRAVASTVWGETDTEDNTFIDGQVEISPGPPVAIFTYSPGNPLVNQIVTFNASASYDLNGYIVNYTWSFGDLTPPVTKNDSITTHNYTAAGNYTVTLKVTDDDELTGTATANITILLPVHDIAILDVTPSPNSVVIGEPVSINVTVANEGDFNETFDVTTYWNFSGLHDVIETKTDISLENGTSTTLTFTWDTTGFSTGTYTISAEASEVPDEIETDDNTFTDGQVEILSPGTPVAIFTYSPGNPLVNQIVTFNASASYDLNGYIVNYTWDFADGSIENGEVVTHTYTETGDYEVTLTVEDNETLSNTASKLVRVAPPLVSPYIAVVPHSTVNPDLTPGTSYTVSIYTDYDGSDITMYQFTLSYNPNVLHGGINYTDTWTGDGANTTFATTGTPVVPDSQVIYVDGTLMTVETAGSDAWIGDNVIRMFNLTGRIVVPYSDTVYVNDTLMTRYTEGNTSWTGDGSTTTFNTTHTPLVQEVEPMEDLIVCVNGTRQNSPRDYIVDYPKGIIEFVTAPANGAEINATYRYGHYIIYYSARSPHPQGEIKFFTAPADGVDIEVTYMYYQYTTDYEEGVITFTFAPDAGAEIKAVYLYGGVTHGDLITTDKDPTARFGTGTFNNNEGKLSMTNGYFFYVVPPPPTVSGPGILANVTFTVVGYGSSLITLGYDTALLGWNFTAGKGYRIIKATYPNNNTWTGNGVTKVFYTTEKPIAIKPSEKVYVNETRMTRSANYTINYDTGEITFTTAPGPGEEIEVTYEYINYDHIQHGYFDNTQAVHDVAVTGIDAPAEAAVGDIVSINVTVTNQGSFPETVNAIAYANTTEIGTQLVTLPSQGSDYISFEWDTTGFSPGTYTLRAEAILDGDSNPINNLYSKSIVIKLTPGIIEGIVTDFSTGEPIEGANVTANSHFNITDAEGHYTITVPPGDYTITASAAGYHSDSISETVISEETITVNLALTPVNGTISGRVTDSSTGDPIAGATITANGISVSTNANGTYSIELPPGTYTVTVSMDGYEDSSNTDITVVSEETTPVDFELTPIQPLNILLYAGAAAIAIVIIAAIAVYFLKVRKPA